MRYRKATDANGLVLPFPLLEQQILSLAISRTATAFVVCAGFLSLPSVSPAVLVLHDIVHAEGCARWLPRSEQGETSKANAGLFSHFSGSVLQLSGGGSASDGISFHESLMASKDRV